MTEYFHLASFGNYVVVGDYFPNLIQVDTSNLSGSGFGNVIQKLNNTAGSDITTANGFNINGNDFDKWDFPPNGNYGQTKTSTSDTFIDMIMVVWRVNHNINKKLNNGGGASSFHDNRNLKNKKGFNATSQFTIPKQGGFGITRHEFAHTIYGANNFHTGGAGAGRRTFMSSRGGYSNLSSFDHSLNCWNGWDRRRMGWKPNSDNYYISAKNKTNTNEVSTDITINNSPEGDTLILRDFVRTNDQIRVKLPHVSDSAKPQWLWLENHQLDTTFDHQARETPGIYAYHQVGKENFSSFGGLGNYTSPFVAHGNYDFIYHQNVKRGDNRIEVPPDRPNPFTGYHLLMRQAIDKNNNGRIGDGELFTANSIEFKSGRISLQHYPVFGNETDAFTPSFQPKIDISTNPAPVPVYTYKHNPPNNPNNLRDFENRTIWLNGLSIQIIDVILSPQNQIWYRIAINWNDWTVDNNVRWCGNIEIKNIPNDPLGRKSKVVLSSNDTMLLDRDITPTQHIGVEQNDDGNWMFSKPTHLTIKSGAAMKTDYDSRLILDDGSKVTIEDNATLNALGDVIIKNGSVMEVKGWLKNNNSGVIRVKNGSVLHLHSNSLLTIANKVKVEAGGTLIYEPGVGIEFPFDDPTINNRLVLHGNLKLEDNATFTYQTTQASSKNGYVYLGGNLQPGTNTEINIQGEGKGDKIVEWGAMEIDSSLEMFTLKNGKVISAGSVKSPYHFEDVKFVASRGAPVLVYGQSEHTLVDCYFENVQLVSHLYFHGNPITMRRDTFTQVNQEAVRTYGQGVTMRHLIFENVGMAWKATGLDHTSYISFTNIRQNINKGIDVSSSHGAVVNISDTRILGFTESGIRAHGAVIETECSRVEGKWNRNSDDKPIAVRLDSFATLESKTTTNTGHTDFGDNWITISADRARALRLNVGYNNLAPVPSSSINSFLCGKFGECPLIMEGTLCTAGDTLSNLNQVHAHNNTWDSTNKSATPQNATWDIALTRCSNGSPIQFIDGDPKQPDCDIGNPCDDTPMGYSCRLDAVSNCPQCVRLLTPDFNNDRLNEALKIAMRHLRSTNPTDLRKSVRELRQIVTYPIDNPKPKERKLQRIAYDKMKKAVGKCFAKEMITSSDNQPTMHQHVRRLIEAQDTVIQRSIARNDYQTRLLTSLDKAKSFRLGDKYQRSIQEYNDILTWVRPSDKPRIKNLKCMTQTEMKILRGQVSPTDYDSVWQECRSSHTTSTQSLSINKKSDQKVDKRNKENTEQDVKVYPNPVEDQLRVKLPGQQTYIVRVFNTAGQTMYDKEKSRLFSVKTEQWPSGVYVVQTINSRSGKSYQRMISVQ